jgi:CRISPR-associated endoribonuclease Cas6/Csy4 subtype I-F
MFKRENVHSNNLIARRKAKRSGISEQEALNHLDKYKEVRIKTPYVNILSNSSRQRFKLFIQQQKVENLSYNGFNSYGLSINSTTVPCF